MTTVNNSLSWVVGLAIVITILALALGLALSHTDLLNFNTSAAEASALNAATQANSEKAQIDLGAYRAQKAAEAAATEAQAAAQQQAAQLQVARAAIDRQAYFYQKTFDSVQRMLDLTRAKTMLAIQVRAEQTRQQMTNDMRQQELNLQFADQQAAAAQQRELASRTYDALLIAGGVLTLAIAVGVIVFFAMLGRSRVIVARARAAQIAAQTASVSAAPDGSERQEQMKLPVWRTVRDLSRKQTQLESELNGMRQAAGGKTPALPTQRKYGDLPLAE